MIIRVLVLSPFRFNFGNKSIYHEAGDCIYLDNANPDERAELKHFMDPKTDHQAWVWIEPELVRDIQAELDAEVQGEPLLHLEPEVVEPTPVVEFSAPPQEPEENIFLPTSDTVIAQEALVEAEPIGQKEVEEVSLTPEPEEVKDEDPRVARQAILEDMHWKTLATLAKKLGIEYTTQDETIEKILEVEFK